MGDNNSKITNTADYTHTEYNQKMNVFIGPMQKFLDKANLLYQNDFL